MWLKKNSVIFILRVKHVWRIAIVYYNGYFGKQYFISLLIQALIQYHYMWRHGRTTLLMWSICWNPLHLWMKNILMVTLLFTRLHSIIALMQWKCCLIIRLLLMLKTIGDSFSHCGRKWQRRNNDIVTKIWYFNLRKREI